MGLQTSKLSDSMLKVSIVCHSREGGNPEKDKETGFLFSQE